MTITLNEDYDVTLSTALLGYVGETNARPVTIEGMEIDGADRYVLTIDYGDGVTYEVDITGGQWTPTADILRSAQTVSCQICAKKLSGDEYILVKKSRIFRLRIGAAIGDTAIPSPDVSMDALDRIDAIGRLAHKDMQTAVTAAETATTAAENAEKSATDAEKSADTAEQAAQAVADSLPEDYTTAVGKIAENTAEISAVKLSDKELQRRVDALYDIGQGITHKFETDTDTAYAKTIPTGAKLMSVKSVGGRSIVFNQMYKKFDNVSGGTLNCKPIFKSHKYLLRVDYSVSENTKVYLYFRDAKYTAETNRQITKDVAAGSGKISWITSPLGEHSDGGDFGVFRMVTDSDGSRKLDTSPFSNYEIFDLTTMFGSGNEPSTVEEFRAMFPNEFYPYNACEIISADTDSVVVQGKNLFDVEKCAALGLYYGFEIDTNKTLQIALKDGKTCPTNVSFGIAYIRGNTMANWLITSQGLVETKTDSSKMTDSTQIMVVCYPGNKETMQSIADAFDIMLVDGIYKPDTMPAYAPFHRNEYPIPDAIKALPGYGVEGNVTDYEAKTYTQNNTIDGTAIKALDTPIITDISSLIPDDFLRNIEVEAGGSVTFKGGNDSYRIPVPSEEEYIVKLSEIGGTT